MEFTINTTNNNTSNSINADSKISSENADKIINKAIEDSLAVGRTRIINMNKNNESQNTLNKIASRSLSNYGNSVIIIDSIKKNISQLLYENIEKIVNLDKSQYDDLFKKYYKIHSCQDKFTFINLVLPIIENKLEIKILDVQQLQLYVSGVNVIESPKYSLRKRKALQKRDIKINNSLIEWNQKVEEKIKEKSENFVNSFETFKCNISRNRLRLMEHSIIINTINNIIKDSNNVNLFEKWRDISRQIDIYIENINKISSEIIQISFIFNDINIMKFISKVIKIINIAMNIEFHCNEYLSLIQSTTIFSSDLLFSVD